MNIEHGTQHENDAGKIVVFNFLFAYNFIFKSSLAFFYYI